MQGELPRVLPRKDMDSAALFSLAMNCNSERFSQLTINKDGSIEIHSSLMFCFDADENPRKDIVDTLGLENEKELRKYLSDDNYVVIETNIRYYPDGSATPIGGYLSYRLRRNKSVE
ncbi:MAG: hypothetical protein LBG86_00565, partial [Puniceicoccales bacterium]|jgi:hypothetical protein|nr:hypothetical protein [Puniceicoccales bacterium]